LSTSLISFFISFLLGLAATIAIAGGRVIEFGDLPIGLRHPWRAAAAAALLALIQYRRSAGAWRWPRAEDLDALPRAAFGAFLVAAAGVAAASLVTVCGGLDSYGYVSQAHAIAEGRLVTPQPLAVLLPFEGAMAAASPLGHVPAADGSGSVPRFPPGLPLVMAAFLIVFGERGPFLVPLVLGIGAVLLTHALAKRLFDATTAALAAALLALDPIFFTGAIQPMSDVPATFWTVAAAVLIAWRVPAGAGVAAGMAVLTRPPLLVVALVLGMCGWWTRRPAAARFGLALAPFVAALLWLHWRLYGDPLASGYGTAEHLFTLARVPHNLWNYAKWMTDVHTPLLYVAIAFALAWGGRQRISAAALLLFAAVLLPYLAYTTYDDWQTIRFVLPGLPFLLILAARGIVAALERVLTARAVAPAAAVVALAAAVASHGFLTGRGVFFLKYQEEKYRLVGDWFATRTRSSTTALASLHTGAIRMYGHRDAVRWDYIPAGRLRETVASLERAGRDAVLALDGPVEEAQFEAHFPREEIASLSMEPVGRIRDINLVRIWAPH
jgi:hypothetical protein